MINKSELREIIAEMKSRGYDVVVRDVFYYFLCGIFDDEKTVYRTLFGENPETSFAEYTVSNMTQDLKSYLSFRYMDLDTAVVNDGQSFDELKQGMYKDLKALEDLRDQKDDDGEAVLDPKEMASVVRQIADIRVKLTEKFGTTEKSEEQRVVVFQKYDSICPYCGREIAVGVKK